MSKIMEIEMIVDENVFKSVAKKLGWEVIGNNLTYSNMFRPLEIKNGKLRYDNMDMETVKNLIGHYVAEITGGTMVKRGKEIYVEVYR